MNQVIENLKDCCGCGACSQACSTKAIQMNRDKYGFAYPFINQSLCVDCHKCISVCPVYSKEEHTIEKGFPRLYSAHAINEQKRKESSSGAVFALIAENVLKNDGVVYAAELDIQLKLKHSRIDDIKDLHRVLKSKYLQSDIGSTYISIRKDLIKGKLVLFCGTPCQCEALSNFLKSYKCNSEHLILIDFICHGVPSQLFFDKSILEWERRHKTRIKSFSFREKVIDYKTEAGLHHWKIVTNDNKIHIGSYIKNPYYYGFLQYMFFRPSCYRCKYAKVDRCTDITLGDFWGLDKIENLPIREFNKGWSMVVVNTPKGNQLFQTTNTSKEEYPLEYAIKYNFAYTNPTIQTKKSISFFNDYDKLSWSQLEKKYMIVKTDLISRGIRFLKRKIFHDS